MQTRIIILIAFLWIVISGILGYMDADLTIKTIALIIFTLVTGYFFENTINTDEQTTEDMEEALTEEE